MKEQHEFTLGELISKIAENFKGQRYSIVSKPQGDGTSKTTLSIDGKEMASWSSRDIDMPIIDGAKLVGHKVYSNFKLL